MTLTALVFPMLVLALTGIVFATAWRSATPLRAFRHGFIWAFLLVLLTPWVGAYSAESAVVNGTAAGLLAVGMWWLVQTRLRPGERVVVWSTWRVSGPHGADDLTATGPPVS